MSGVMQCPATRPAHPAAPASPRALWALDAGRITCRFDGEIVYEDSTDHWTNAVCRLMGITELQAQTWVETAAELSLQRTGRSLAGLEADAREKVLADAASRALFSVVGCASAHASGISPGAKTCAKAHPTELTAPSRHPGRSEGSLPSIAQASARCDADLSDTDIRPKGRTTSDAPGACGHPADTVWQRGIGIHDDLLAIGCSRCRHGWLAAASDAGVIPAKAIEYNEDYFEGNAHGLGYGDYLRQQSWRMEKSRRFLRQVLGMRQYSGVPIGAKPVALDVGSGYGFFRKALDEAGWAHDGIELSQYACRMAESLFGFETPAGTLEAFAAERRGHTAGGYDLITLWDVIEHVEDPASLLRTARRLLRPDGALALRTPNLLAVEHAVFGRYYHSFKKEHLQYFSPRSIATLGERAGLRASLVATQSTLLAGFSASDLRLAEATQRGADIFALLTNSRDL